jgi:hypothetical protein
VVVDNFLTPIWERRQHILEHIKTYRSLEETHKKLSHFQGWGGGGFMAYEVVSDLVYTPVLQNPVDRFTWANAGPGAKRGLNRIHGRELNKSLKKEQCNDEMVALLNIAKPMLGEHVPWKEVDMRTIEHSLCEWDKYQRVLLKQGRPRSLFKPQDYIKRGGV